MRNDRKRKQRCKQIRYHGKTLGREHRTGFIRKSPHNKRHPFAQEKRDACFSSPQFEGHQFKKVIKLSLPVRF